MNVTNKFVAHPFSSILQPFETNDPPPPDLLLKLAYKKKDSLCVMAQETWHKMQTLLLFVTDMGKIYDAEKHRNDCYFMSSDDVCNNVPRVYIMLKNMTKIN